MQEQNAPAPSASPAAPDDSARPEGGPRPVPMEVSPEAPVSPQQSEADAGPIEPRVPPDIAPELLDADAVRVLLRLRQHGHEAYLVGGCVRDLLLGRTPKDFDIATSAHPNEIRNLFRNCRLIGRRFRLAHIFFKGGKILEVSTFRALPVPADEPAAVAEAADGEHRVLGVDGEEDPPVAPEPESDLLVTEDNTFGTAIEDARRRDFTINGLFYDPAVGKVIDHVKGLRDLNLRQIRTIGDPETRLREDPVRILRAVRFACKLELDIESRTYAAMEGTVEDLERCSAPRLLEETFRLIRGGNAAGALKLLIALDALRVLLPPVDAHLKANGLEAEEELLSFAEALDAEVRAGVPYDDAMLLAALLLPLSVSTPETPEQANAAEEGGRMQLGQALEALLFEFVRTARLPRRIAERCRTILFAQPTLAGKRRRRGGLASYRRHPLYAEALKVFEVWVKASGEHEEALAAWKAGAAPQPSPDAPGPSRRRRRRRGGAGREGPPAGAPGVVAPPETSGSDPA